ncbi:MAG TPA: DinB family protein [Longimicrobium sp.]
MTMDGEGASFRELLAYTDAETERWRAWLAEQGPEVLDLRMGEGNRETLRDVIGHVFMVELRYAQRLLGRPVTGYEQVDMSTLEALWRIHHGARSTLRTYLERLPAGEREREMTFDTRTLGPFTASAHKVTVHALMHGIRHWAQVAMALRQAGHRQPWEHDWLVCDAVH